MDGTNRFGVAAAGKDRVAIMLPPREPITSDDAIVLAAWLVVMAGIQADWPDAETDRKFAGALAAIRES